MSNQCHNSLPYTYTLKNVREIVIVPGCSSDWKNDDILGGGPVVLRVVLVVLVFIIR